MIIIWKDYVSLTPSFWAGIQQDFRSPCKYIFAFHSGISKNKSSFDSIVNPRSEGIVSAVHNHTSMLMAIVANGMICYVEVYEINGDHGSDVLLHCFCESIIIL